MYICMYVYIYMAGKPLCKQKSSRLDSPRIWKQILWAGEPHFSPGSENKVLWLDSPMWPCCWLREPQPDLLL